MDKDLIINGVGGSDGWIGGGLYHYVCQAEVEQSGKVGKRF